MRIIMLNSLLHPVDRQGHPQGLREMDIISLQMWSRHLLRLEHRLMAPSILPCPLRQEPRLMV